MLLAGSCSNAGNPQCRFGADCASGVCTSQGTCVPLPSNDASIDAPDSTDAIDGNAETPPPTDAPLGCTPNGDDLITALELPFAAGLKATFRTATNVTVSTAGDVGAGGRRHWDFSAALSGDHDLLVETIPPSGAWWSSKFPSATYATSITSTADLLGVFEVTSSALLLQGEVSSTDGGARTLLTNATPVPTLQFPLDPSSVWTATTFVNGTTAGVPSSYTESYDSKVDAVGDVVTPFATFPVLRVRTVLTRTVGALPTVVRTLAFVTDCFGPVVTITSQPNETQDDFTNAAEIRRLAP
jgi:hypothetical protein